MRIGIIGAGAIGGWLGARLSRAGEAVSVLARGATLDAIRAGGLVLREAGEESRSTVAASDDGATLGVQDMVVIAVKAPSLAAAAEAAAPMIGPDTSIVPMLNGVPWWFMTGAGGGSLASIDPDGRISRALPFGQVIGSVVHASSASPAPGLVVHGFGNGLILGEPLGGVSDRAARAAALFAGAGLEAMVSADIRRDIWYKLWGNMTMNPVSALTGATSDRILDDPLAEAFILRVMEEAARIGAAVGCPIEASGKDRMDVTRRLGAFKTSMLQDVEAGRPLELDALLAAPREIGRGLGIDTPWMDALLGLTRLFAGSRGLCPPA
jgi:2-dehydropantoate 2-reductase